MARIATLAVISLDDKSKEGTRMSPARILPNLPAVTQSSEDYRRSLLTSMVFEVPRSISQQGKERLGRRNSSGFTKPSYGLLTAGSILPHQATANETLGKAYTLSFDLNLRPSDMMGFPPSPAVSPPQDILYYTCGRLARGSFFSLKTSHW